jgi:hypothetical protein
MPTSAYLLEADEASALPKILLIIQPLLLLFGDIKSM